jgi:transcriptional regulator with XRE-family HTH domain
MAPPLIVRYDHRMADDQPGRPLTLNEVTAANILLYRNAAGLTQRELGARLGWSNVSVSEAERSRDGRIHREFDAAELAALAWALGIPLIALFLPPPGDDGTGRYEAGPVTLDAAEMLAALIMPDSDDDTPAMQAYLDRFNTLAGRWLDPEWAAVAARWTGDADGEPDARATAAARFRDRAARLRDLAAEDDQIAAAMEGDAP